MNPLSATAIELAQAYRARTLSPVEVTQAILDAIPHFNSLNAFCHLNPDLALSAASASEQRYKTGTALSGLGRRGSHGCGDLYSSFFPVVLLTCTVSFCHTAELGRLRAKSGVTVPAGIFGYSVK